MTIRAPPRWRGTCVSTSAGTALAAVAFAGQTEKLVMRHLSGEPSAEALERFSEALRVALDDNLVPRPLCGIGGLPSCESLSFLRANYLRDMQALGTDGLNERLRVALLADTDARARASLGSSADLSAHVPLLDMDHS